MTHVDKDSGEVIVGMYWRRKQVEPYQQQTFDLHRLIEPGTYVVVEETPLYAGDAVHYHVILPRRAYNDSDIISSKLFKLYFQPVTEENELGLIALAELDNKCQTM